MPETLSEAMVAAGSLDMASTFDDADGTVNRAMEAADRVTRFLASTAGMRAEEFGGSLYLPESAASPWVEARA